MKEYIEKDAARDLMERALEDDWEIQYANDRLRDIPAANVVEVRHGEWRYRPNLIKAKTRKWPVVECDKCGMSCCDVINCMSEMYHYCPNCGADMREV